MNIYVGNLHVKASEEQLRGLFKQYGEVISASIVYGINNGLSRGFGFVEMSEDIDGAKAMSKLNNKNFMSQYLEVSEAMAIDPRDKLSRSRSVKR
jgi:RNA recognition motif-containing protein